MKKVERLLSQVNSRLVKQQRKFAVKNFHGRWYVLSCGVLDTPDVTAYHQRFSGKLGNLSEVAAYLDGYLTCMICEA